MAFAPTQFQDCLNIIKAFERGAIYSPTQESVCAMMTPVLQNMITTTQTYADNLDNSLQLSNQISTATEAKDANSIPEKQQPDFANTTRTNSPFITIPEENENKPDVLGTLFDSDCFPCDFRTDSMPELNFKTAIEANFNQFKDILFNHLETMVQQIQEALKLFEGWDKYPDICAFIKWIQDFVCVPDLARIISILMALLTRVSFDLFGGLFGLIAQLIIPLLFPFLTNLVNVLQEYILLIVRPIECIIESLQAIIRKLDYSVFFDNLPNLEIQHDSFDTVEQSQNVRAVVQPSIDESEAQKFATNAEGKQIKVPVLDSSGIARSVIPRRTSTDLSFGIADDIKIAQQEAQQAVEVANRELMALDQAAKNIDGTDIDRAERHLQQRREAQNRYDDAVARRNAQQTIFSGPKQVDRALGQGLESFRSIIYDLISMLYEAASAVEGIFRSIFDEFRKLAFEFNGSTNGVLGMLIQKAGIVQMLGLMRALYDIIKTGKLNCDEDDASDLADILPVQRGANVWTDNLGNLHIDDNEEDLNDIIDELVAGTGSEDGKSKTTLDPSVKPKNKFNALIPYTGDPTLDSRIASLAEQLTTANKVTFKCPLQNTVVDAEKVNQWIEELS